MKTDAMNGDIIGRKLYIGWGENVVVAIEKLNIPAKSMGLEHTIKDCYGTAKHLKLVNIVTLMGERVEVPVKGVLVDMDVTELGAEFQEFLTNKYNWATDVEFDWLDSLESGDEG